MDEHTLDCQACGAALFSLTLAQQQRVADDPYAYVVFCRSCQELGAHIEEVYA